MWNVRDSVLTRTVLLVLAAALAACRPTIVAYPLAASENDALSEPPLPSLTLLVSAVTSTSNLSAFVVGGLCNAPDQSVSVKLDSVPAAMGDGAGLCNGTLWSGTIDVSALAEGQHTIQGHLSNSAGEEVDSDPITFVKDTISPTVTITSTTPSVTNLAPIPVSVSFTEPVSGFTAEGLNAVNGSISQFTGSGATYSFQLVPLGPGAVSVDLLASRALDAVGNPNLSAAQFTRIYDPERPGLVLTSGAASPTNASPISVTATFTKPVSGFALDDISVSNGSAFNLAGTGANYTFQVVPSDQGPVTIDVAANRVSDVAGNGNTAAAQLTRTYDNSRPAVTLSSATSGTTNLSPIQMTAIFNEPVLGFALSGVTVTNGTAGTLSGADSSYTFQVVPSGNGAVSVRLEAGQAQDAAGNLNLASNTYSFTYDSQNPSLVIASTSPAATNLSPIPVTVTFSKPVTGFDLSDVVVSNGTAGAFAGTGASYSFSITPSGQGTVSVDVPAGAAQDSSGNLSTAGARLSRTYDTGSPSVTLSSAAPSLTNVSPIPVTLLFSEDVTGLTTDDIVVVNGSVADFSGSGAGYSFNIIPAGQGLVTVDLPGARTIDLAGNGNIAASQLSRTYDSIAPSVALASTAATSTNASPIPVTAIFSEAVTGFALSDIVVSNGAAGNFSGSGTSYAFEVTPAGEGAVLISIAGGVATDATGNLNTAAPALTRTFDSSGPSVTLSSTTSALTNVSPIPVTVTFSESVTGFALTDISVAGGSASSLSGSGDSYSFQVTPSGQGSLSIEVVVDAAQDAVGNKSLASNQLTRTYDTIRPSVTLTSTAGATTALSPIPVAITFSEPVIGFTIDDLTVTNGSASGLAGSGATYTANIVPAGQGTVAVDLASGIAADGAGNLNTQASQLTRVYSTQVVSASKSTVAVAPATLPNDGSSTSTVTVTLRDASDNPVVVGRTVRINIMNSGANCTVSGFGTVTTNSSGMATFTVRSGTLTGATQVTIINDTDSITLDQRPYVYTMAARPWTEYRAGLASSGSSAGLNSPLTVNWKDLASSGSARDGGLNGYTNSGWSGSGSQALPYQLTFNGTDQFVDFTNAVNNSASFSFEAWIKPSSSTTAAAVILGNGDGANHGLVLDQAGASRKLNLSLGTNGLGSCPSRSSLIDNVWNHVAGVFSGAGATLKLYVNGYEECTTTDPGYIYTGSANSLRAGADSAGAKSWAGSIAEIRTFDAAISAANVLAIFNQTRSQYPVVTASSVSLSASPSSITADNASTATITITVKDSMNNAIAGFDASSITLAASGTGNTIVQPAGVTNASGQTSATIRSNVAEAKTISISAPAYLAAVPSASVTFTLPAPGTPAAPTISGATSSSLIVSWGAVSGANSYTVARSTDANMTGAVNLGTKNSGFTDSGLNASTTYYYTVTAVNDTGPSSPSPAGNGTTSAAAAAYDTGTSGWDITDCVGTRAGGNPLPATCDEEFGGPTFRVKKTLNLRAGDTFMFKARYGSTLSDGEGVSVTIGGVTRLTQGFSVPNDTQKTFSFTTVDSGVKEVIIELYAWDWNGWGAMVSLDAISIPIAP